MKNCSSCKHKMSMYTGLMDNSHSLVGYQYVLTSKSVVTGDFYVKCANGNTEDCLNWWIENKNVPTNETSEMSCFEPTEFSTRTQEMIDLLDKIKDTLNK